MATTRTRASDTPPADAPSVQDGVEGPSLEGQTEQKPQAGPVESKVQTVPVIIAHYVSEGALPGVEKDYGPGDKAAFRPDTARLLVRDGVARYA